MTTLDAVKRALKRGKRKEAIYALRRILQYSPSAEAHYLAARLTKSKVKHLRKALADPSDELQTALSKNWG